MVDVLKRSWVSILFFIGVCGTLIAFGDEISSIRKAPEEIQNVKKEHTTLENQLTQYFTEQREFIASQGIYNEQQSKIIDQNQKILQTLIQTILSRSE